MSAEYRIVPAFPTRPWRECMTALGFAVLDGKGGLVPYDPSKPYIEETGLALRAWVIRNCCGKNTGRYRAAGARVTLVMALHRIDAMATWLRSHGKDGLATDIEEDAKALLAACPFRRGGKDDARRTLRDDREFDRRSVVLWQFADSFQHKLKQILVLLGKENGPDGGHLGKDNKQQAKVELDAERLRVRVGKRWYDVNEQQKDMLATLIAAKGGWVLGKNITAKGSRRPHQIRGDMLKPVAAIIETDRHKGYRILALLP